MTFTLEETRPQIIEPFKLCENCPMKPINNAQHTIVCVQCKKDKSPIGVPCEHCNPIWLR